MSRFSFSNQPAAWVAFVTAALDVAATLGLPVTDAAKAAVVTLVTALGAVVTWHQVTPNVRVPAPILAPPVEVPGPVTVDSVRSTLADLTTKATASQHELDSFLAALAAAQPPPAPAPVPVPMPTPDPIPVPVPAPVIDPPAPPGLVT